MHQAHLTLDSAFRVGPVQHRTSGSFVEHLGRCVYTGIYEPGPTADQDGFRGTRGIQDSLDLLEYCNLESSWNMVRLALR